MKASVTLVALGATVLLTGCDLSLDNYAEPRSMLTGRVVFDGQPVGVRNGGVRLELWEPGWELNQKIDVHVHQDGTFSSILFDGTYKLNLLANNGPWVTKSDTLVINLNRQAEVDFPVEPYYVIRDPRITHNPGGGGPNGTISAAFKVGRINTSRNVEWVGLYVGLSTFVDRVNSISVPNAQRERVASLIQSQLGSNSDITISVQLPANIYETQSPARREHVYVRIGVKTVGVAEMLFSEVQKVAI